jgi:hypothetical protein
MSKYLDNRGDYNVRVPAVKYLDTNGDGTGTTNATGDYATTPTTFFYGPPAGEVYVAEKLIWQISDKGAFGIDVFGALAAALPNGVEIEFWRLGQLVLKLTNGEPVKTNAGMTRINTDYRKIPYTSNYESAFVSLNAESFGGPLYMVGDLQDQIRIPLTDNFTGLDNQYFILYGVS